MNTTQIFFWISLGCLFYTYAGYGLLVFLLNSGKALFAFNKSKMEPLSVIPVTIIVTAYNEETFIEKKIINTLNIDYPPDKLQIIFITDGSSDSSLEILSKYPSVKWMHQPERKGKYAAIKRAMQAVSTPIVFFSDANTLLNKDCIKRMLPHYNNPKTGAVAGEKKILKHNHISAVGQAEGLYWQYETIMKKLDARFYTLIGAAGELYSIRTSLFKPLAEEVILDDFVISMQVCLQGYTIAYEPGAFATESPSVSLLEEEKRKVRIAAGDYQSIGYLKGCLNIFRHPVLSFQYISRRLLRWVFSPGMLIILLFTNILIVINHPVNEIYYVIFYLQIVFYLFAFTGWLFIISGKKTSVFTIPFYFVFMNYCLIKGFVKFVYGRQSVLWDKSLRQALE